MYHLERFILAFTCYRLEFGKVGTMYRNIVSTILYYIFDGKLVSQLWSINWEAILYEYVTRVSDFHVNIQRHGRVSALKYSARIESCIYTRASELQAFRIIRSQ